MKTSQPITEGRPLYYDIPEGVEVNCLKCVEQGNSKPHAPGQAVMNDPANSPLHDGGVYTLCLAHIPHNAVIHDPVHNVTRTKDGKNTWTQPDTPRIIQ